MIGLILKRTKGHGYYGKKDANSFFLAVDFFCNLDKNFRGRLP